MLHAATWSLRVGPGPCWCGLGLCSARAGGVHWPRAVLAQGCVNPWLCWPMGRVGPGWCWPRAVLALAQGVLAQRGVGQGLRPGLCWPRAAPRAVLAQGCVGTASSCPWAVLGHGCVVQDCVGLGLCRPRAVLAQVCVAERVLGSMLLARGCVDAGLCWPRGRVGPDGCWPRVGWECVGPALRGSMGVSAKGCVGQELRPGLHW